MPADTGQDYHAAILRPGDGGEGIGKHFGKLGI